MPYRTPCRKTRSATPLTKLPLSEEVWSDGSPETTVLRCPARITEMRDVNPPL
jgi:hypothetical protein